MLAIVLAALFGLLFLAYMTNVRIDEVAIEKYNALLNTTTARTSRKRFDFLKQHKAYIEKEQTSGPFFVSFPT